LPFGLAAPEEPVTVSTNAPSTAVRVMRKLGPPTTCFSCAHPECDRRRRELRVPCVVCEARILPGQFYRVLSTVNGEVTSQIHHDCERRRFDR
jgi:hypothetical protein